MFALDFISARHFSKPMHFSKLVPVLLEWSINDTWNKSSHCICSASQNAFYDSKFLNLPLLRIILLIKMDHSHITMKNPVSAANELSNLASIQCVKWHFNGKQVRQFEYNELQPISYVTLSVSLITVQLWNRLNSKRTIAYTSFKRKYNGIYNERKECISVAHISLHFKFSFLYFAVLAIPLQFCSVFQK